MGEGRHTEQVAAPRSLSQVRADLAWAKQVGDQARVALLEAELRQTADRASRVDEGGRRGG